MFVTQGNTITTNLAAINALVTTLLNELNKYFRNYSENIPMKTKS